MFITQVKICVTEYYGVDKSYSVDRLCYLICTSFLARKPMMSEQNKDNNQNNTPTVPSAGGFVFKRDRYSFMVSSKFVLMLAESKVDFTVILSYILLARGVEQLDDRRTTSTNAGFIISKTQWEEDTVKNAIEWLRQHDYIELVDVIENKEKVSHWQIKDGQLDILLPVTLIDGNGVTPLTRLYSPRILSEEDNLRQMDHLVAICMLYLYNNMALYAGINPRIGLYREWLDFNEAANGPVLNILNSDAAIYEVRGRTMVHYENFANALFTYIADPNERLTRIANSLQKLVLNGFLYETTQIWDGNPIIKGEDEAQPMYTIYIHDPISKTDEPELQRMIQRVAYRLGIKDGYKEFTEADYEKGESVNFRYVADKQVGGYPIGVFRLKFRILSDNDVTAVDVERVRAASWLSELQVLNYLKD